MGAYKRSALSRLRTAQDLLALWRTPVALTMQREAAILAAAAIFVSRGEQPDDNASPDAVFDRLERLFGRDGIEPPPEYQRARPILFSTEPRQWDRLPASEVVRRGEDLSATVRWLTGLIDPSSPRDLRLLSIRRLLVAALSSVVAVLLLPPLLFAPRNLALDKPVTVIGVAYGTMPEHVVDGNKTAIFDFHSIDADEPWLVIDLGRTHPIDRVEVFGRGDCCYDQSIPLALLVSNDGITYRKVAVRHEPFSLLVPWVQGHVGAARFVKLQVQRHGMLVIGEVEVYGR
jgi:hypothetical protein